MSGAEKGAMSGDTLTGRLRGAAEARPERDVLRTRTEAGLVRHPYGELYEDMLKAAAGLRGLGVEAGDRVGLCLENGRDWPVAYFGVLLAGATAVPMDVQASREDVEYFVEFTEAKVVFASDPAKFGGLVERGVLGRIVAPSRPGTAAGEGGTPATGGGARAESSQSGEPSSRRTDVRSKVANARTLSSAVLPMADLLAAPPLAEPARAKPSDVASILFTSGTTGRPKGVMLTHANFLAQMDSIDALRIVGEGDDFLSILPLHHAYPFTVNLLVPLLLGCRAIFLTTLRPEAILAALKEDGVAILMLTPQYVGVFHRRMLKRLAELPLGSGRLLAVALRAGRRAEKAVGINPAAPLRRIVRRTVGPRFRFFISGGAKLDPEVGRDMTALGLDVFEGYGLTETAPVLTINPPGRAKDGAAGQPLPGVELRIAKPEAPESPETPETPEAVEASEAPATVEASEAVATVGASEAPESLESVESPKTAESAEMAEAGEPGGSGDAGREGGPVVGEILARGPNLMAGYYRNEQATAEAVDKEGWFHTGDLGWLDADGYLFIQGRSKEVLVLGSGKKVQPEELEKRFLEAPTIKEIGLLVEPGRDALVAVIVPDLAALAKRDSSDVRGSVRWDLERVAAGLPPYERPKSFALSREELPRTRLGKIKRHLLPRVYQERLEAERSGEPVQAEDLTDRLSPAGRRIAEILKRQSGVKALAADAHLELDLGLDSLSRAELLTELEDEFGVRLPEEEFLGLATVGELVERVEGWVSSAEEAGSGERRERSWGELLRQPLSPEAARLVRISLAPWERLLRGLLTLVLVAVCRLVWQVERIGGDAPPAGPLLVCPNHGSYLDGFFVICAARPTLRDRLFFIGAGQYFDVPVLRRLAPMLRVISVTASRNLIETLQVSARVLEAGQALCVFPEGARSMGELRSFKKGPAILAKELNVPMLPVYIAGSYATWNPTMRFPRPAKVRVFFGRPASADELAAKGRALEPEADDYRAISLGLREEVAALQRTAGEGMK